jgi:predicted negative regulator of RcsB-dependent stress response
VADHMQDEADLEALKRWWDENGKGLVGAVAVAGLGTLGWQQYQDYSSSQVEAASDLYASMLSTQLEGGDPDQLTAVAEILKEDHGGTAYDLATAETALRWALSAGNTRDDFGQLIQLRLARVLAAQDKEAEALAILAQGSSAYPIAYFQAVGDIHLAGGQTEEALMAYRAGRDASVELGQMSAVLDNKVRTLETRVPVAADGNPTGEAS